jgi:hypothetical protein
VLSELAGLTPVGKLAQTWAVVVGVVLLLPPHRGCRRSTIPAPVGDELQHLGGHQQPLRGGLLLQDRRDISDQDPLEPRAQSVLHPGQVLGPAVGRYEDLLVCVVQGVERMEELLLSALAVVQELDVADQQHVDVPESLWNVAVVS